MEEESWPLPVPVKPKEAEPPTGRLPFQFRFRTVTWEPLVERSPFQSWVMDWPLARVHLTVHPVVGDEPVFLTVTSAWKPPGHWLTSLYVASHALPAGGWDGDGEGEGLLGEGDGLLGVGDGLSVGGAAFMASS